LSEKQYIKIRVSFGLATVFQQASGTKTSYDRIQGHIFKNIKCISSQMTHDELGWQEIETWGVYIIDQLIFFATREQAGDEYLQLACLFFE
jgi:hypothetical protein